MADVVSEASFGHLFPRRGTRSEMKAAAGAEKLGSAPGAGQEGEGTLAVLPAVEFRSVVSSPRHIWDQARCFWS